jgi:hypothetical protein
MPPIDCPVAAARQSAAKSLFNDRKYRRALKDALQRTPDPLKLKPRLRTVVVLHFNREGL